jgi:hypothetical protein
MVPLGQGIGIPVLSRLIATIRNNDCNKVAIRDAIGDIYF